MNNEVFVPFRLVAEFADGSRLTFDGLTEEQAEQNMEAAQNKHGCIAWYDGVTDTNYEKGKYYKLIPQPPTVNIVDMENYAGRLDENSFPTGLVNEISKQAEGEASIILKHTKGDYLSGIIDQAKDEPEIHIVPNENES